MSWTILITRLLEYTPRGIYLIVAGGGHETLPGGETAASP